MPKKHWLNTKTKKTKQIQKYAWAMPGHWLGPASLVQNKNAIWKTYPKGIDSCSLNSWTTVFHKKNTTQKLRLMFWWATTYVMTMFAENQNGPYGPYEQLLWDISPNQWRKSCFFDGNCIFWKMVMSKNPKHVVLVYTKTLRGARTAENCSETHSQTFPTQIRPISILEIVLFDYFSWTS